MSVREKYIGVATQIAYTSKCKFPLGAVLVQRGKIVAKSANIMMRCPTNANFRWATLHAEEAVIQQGALPKGCKCVCFTSRS